MPQFGEEAIGTTGETPYPPPLAPQQTLWRGPLILTGISRISMVPWYLFCAVSATSASMEMFAESRRYSPRHLFDQMILTGSLWWFFLFSVLLAWLFFTRHRAFPPLMRYFCFLLLALVAGLIAYMKRYPIPPSHEKPPLGAAVAGISIAVFALSGTIWPFYYLLSPRVRRVFTR